MAIRTAFMCRTQFEPTGKKNRLSRSQSVHSSVEAGKCPWSEGTQEDGFAIDRNARTTTVASAGNGSTRRRRPAPLELDRTGGLDGANVDGSRTGSERRLLVSKQRRWPNAFFAEHGL